MNLNDALIGHSERAMAVDLTTEIISPQGGFSAWTKSYPWGSFLSNRPSALQAAPPRRERLTQVRRDKRPALRFCHGPRRIDVCSRPRESALWAGRRGRTASRSWFRAATPQRASGADRFDSVDLQLP